MGSVTENWQSLAATKRASTASKIPKEWLLPSKYLDTISPTSPTSVLHIPRESNILSPTELSITEDHDATSLLSLMASGDLKSYDVVLAFCKRAAIAQQLVNCCTEIMFEEALVRARECDEFFAKEGKTMGALHGLPISLKDSFNVKNIHTTIGYVSFISNPPAERNGNLVELLYGQGAVFYVKTNLPQTMMTADSDNNVFGRTLNPNKLCLTVGGSTGGEGALLKLRGSPLGLTTDIAGSTRIPALCNGVIGLKPTASRIPFGGNVPPGRLGSPGSIIPCIGPLAHSVRDIELFMKITIDAQPWAYDENVLNIPWRRVDVPTTPLRFGLIRGHPQRPLHPPIARALHTAATALKKAGHEIVLLDNEIPDLWDCAVLGWKYFLLDPRRTAKRIVEDAGEPWVPSIKTAVFEELSGWEPGLDEVWDMNVQRGKVVRVYHDLVVEKRLDAILMPGYQATAVPHDMFGVPVYTVVQNLINYPAAILPFLEANQELDRMFFRDGVDYEPPYNPDEVEGAPAAIQLMGIPMKDEELVKIMGVVEDVLKGVK